MRGERVPAGTRWSGNPIGPWREVTTPTTGAPGRVLTGGGLARLRSAGDPYMPRSGNGGYRVDAYELDLDYRRRPQPRWPGTAGSPPSRRQDLTRFSLDLAALRVTQGAGRRRSRRKFDAAAEQARASRCRNTVAAGAEFTVVVRYSGAPRPVRSPWGEVGWEELTDGVIVASQPSGASTWFPCNDHPADKATYRITCHHRRRRTRSSANGELVSSVARAPAATTWVYEQAEPMADLPRDGADRPVPAARRQRSGRDDPVPVVAHRRATSPRGPRTTSPARPT